MVQEKCFVSSFWTLDNSRWTTFSCGRYGCTVGAY